MELFLCAGDEDSVRKLLLHAPLSLEAPKWTSPHTKANALLQAHFSRTPLAGDLAADQRSVVQQAVRLLQARFQLPFLLPSVDTLHCARHTPLLVFYQVLLLIRLI